MPADSLETAVSITCAQRNRLRGVRSSTPALIALGQLPHRAGGIADEPFHNRDLGGEHNADVHRRVAAAIAFVQANDNRAIGTALMARGRPPPSHDFNIGDFCYYWRVEGDKVTEKCHWHGPAMISTIEPSPDPESAAPRIYWLIHGTALIRCVREQRRPELPEERGERPAQSARRSRIQTIIDKLKRVQGPVGFLDITTTPVPDYVDTDDLMDGTGASVEQPSTDGSPADAVPTDYEPPD